MHLKISPCSLLDMGPARAFTFANSAMILAAKPTSLNMKRRKIRFSSVRMEASADGLSEERKRLERLFLTEAEPGELFKTELILTFSSQSRSTPTSDMIFWLKQKNCFQM